MLHKPVLPPRKGYVEVDVGGVRCYKNAETGQILGGPADLAAVKSAKLAELSAACNDAIVAGCGVT
uniref:hypothetical protein n=1 Tax=uncultured Dysosmobacter sp. TaxID=2591384 RepID=UPI0026032C34